MAKMGRPRGRITLRANPKAKELLFKGISPLEVFIILMRKSWKEYLILEKSLATQQVVTEEELKAMKEARDDAFNFATAAAPYCHARLTSVKVDEEGDKKAEIVYRPEDDNL